MSSRATRIGVAEAKARFAEIVSRAPQQRTIIQRRGKDVAVVIAIEELARIERANDGSTEGARLLARLDQLKRAAGGSVELDVEPIDDIPYTDPFARPKKRS